LPQTLDQTYERILTSISEKDSVFAIRILQWLTFSARPLSLEEVAEVVAIDVAREPAFVRDEVLVDPLEVLDICSTLVTITTDKAMGRSKLGSRIITLAHYSVQEYLVSDRIKRGPAKLYSMEETESHAVIMKGSLGYLNQFQYPIPREILRISMLSRYSAQFWISHLRKTGDKMEGLSRIAMSLFSIESPAYLIWIRLCDPDNPSQEPQFRSGLKSIPKPLYYAALLGLSTVTELLLGGGVEVNAKGGFFGSALQAASACGYKDVVQLLLDAGAEVNAQGGSCGNALRAALANEHETTVRLLINKGASVGPDAMLKGIMHHALNNPRCALSLATVLVEHGAPLDTIDVDNMTPLHYCVKFGHIAIAKQLIHAGTPVDCRARRQSRASEDDILNTGRADSMSPILRSVTIGLTPLHFAALTGNATMTHFLLEHGADPNAQSEYGETPLHLTLRTRLSGTIYQDDWNNQNRAIDFFDSKTEAIKNGDSRVSLNRRQVLDALLADPRISVTATDYRGECPLHCIQYGEPGCATLVQKLVSKGADPCCGNLRQESPLHLAIRADDHAAVVTLLSMGAKVALTDERGLNALHYAAQTGNHETMVAILGTDEAKTAELIVSKDKIGQTVLHHYLSVRPSGIQVATLRWLLDEGADSLELDNNGVSPLAKFIKIPAWVIDDDVCMLLLAIRGNESFVDHDGQGLGHLCAATPVFGVYILQMLKVYNVDLSTKDSDGRTVLHRATICGRLTEESLNFLVNVVGIQASEKDAHGCTALQYAVAAAGKDYRDIGWSNSRWERIRDVLVEYHANHPD
jgi:ankyrin repeat protein